MSEQLRRPAQPDPLDQLLNRFLREADLETKGKYASFWLRVVARLVDTAIVLAVAYAIYYSFVGVIREDNTINADYIINNLKQAVPALALMIWVLVYSPIMEATGGTIGKRIVGIKLVDEKTLQTPDFRYCMARTWVYLVLVVLAVIPAVIACLAVFVSPKRQAWHDRLTGMVAIKRK
jgi:uncharacterized RDD family membrane protein YckC